MLSCLTPEWSQNSIQGCGLRIGTNRCGARLVYQLPPASTSFHPRHKGPIHQYRPFSCWYHWFPGFFDFLPQMPGKTHQPWMDTTESLGS